MNDVCHTVYIPREFLMLWPVFDNDDLLTAVCVKLLGLYVPVYMFYCMSASVSGLMALLVLWIFH